MNSNLQEIHEELIYRLTNQNFTKENIQIILKNVDELLSKYTFEKSSIISPYLSNEKLIQNFLLAKEMEGLSQGSLNVYRIRLKDFINNIDNKSVLLLSSNDIRNYLLNFKTRKNNSNRTVEHCRTVLCSFYNYLYCEDLVQKSPMVNIKKIKFLKTQKQSLTPSELEAVRFACRNNLRDSALLEFLLSTGCRAGEIQKITLQDINFETKEVQIIGKGNKQRTVYIGPKAEGALKRYLQKRPYKGNYLFPGRLEENGLSVSGVEYIINKIGRVAKLDRKLNPHDIRRTTATMALSHGMPIEEIKSILGHTSIDTTLIYAKVNNTQVKLDHLKFLDV